MNGVLPSAPAGGSVNDIDNARGLTQRGGRLGQYELRGLLGSGAMAQVFEAEHLGLHKRVAVKVLYSHLTERPDIVERFVQEGIAAARIRHANIVDVTDVGVEGATPFLVMELLEGLPLSVLIARLGTLGPADAAWLMMPIVDAVAHAHKAGVIHRDLKPDNIFVVMGPNDVPTPKILDFGISKLVDDTAGPIHSDGMLGTPIFCAPEQAACADDVDERCDQYALGAILYNCLTGCPPFDPDDSLLSVLRKVQDGNFQPPSVYRSDLPPAFEEIVLRAMSRRREDRYPNLEMMRSALRRYGLGAKPSAWMQHLRAADDDAPTDVSADDWDPNALTSARSDTPSHVRSLPPAVPLAPTVSLGSPRVMPVAAASPVDGAYASGGDASASGPVSVEPSASVARLRLGLLLVAVVAVAGVALAGIHSATSSPERPALEPLVATEPGAAAGAEADTAAIDTAATDTAAIDTAAIDTAATDTAAIDTAAIDTAAIDTAAIDTAAIDTAAIDTAATDTAATDATLSDTTASGTSRADATRADRSRAEAFAREPSGRAAGTGRRRSTPRTQSASSMETEGSTGVTSPVTETTMRDAPRYPEFRDPWGER
jgi:serine/threonine-protein kinase